MVQLAGREVRSLQEQIRQQWQQMVIVAAIAIRAALKSRKKFQLLVDD